MYAVIPSPEVANDAKVVKAKILVPTRVRIGFPTNKQMQQVHDNPPEIAMTDEDRRESSLRKLGRS